MTMLLETVGENTGVTEGWSTRLPAPRCAPGKAGSCRRVMLLLPRGLWD